MSVEQCVKCGGLYSWARMGPVVPGGKEREEVACPHCGDVKFSEMTSQFFYVQVANDDEVQRWTSANNNKGNDV